MLHRRSGMCDTEKMLSLQYMQPYITTPVSKDNASDFQGIDQQGNEDHPKMWINWNSRTFVVGTKKKGSKEKQLETQEEEEEEDNPDKVQEPKVSFLIKEELEQDSESTPPKRLSGKQSPQQPENYFSIQDKANWYCVFPTHHNVGLKERLYD